ncbi:MAG: sensor histidine kinase [Ardenticatenales bacterium]|nr:sensor histidine kinase [Ardenticatenales bacterium]
MKARLQQPSAIINSRLRRLRWKLTWSYTWVAALSFLIVETVLLILVLAVLGFNPLRRDVQFYADVVKPVLVDDIRPITMAHMRNRPVDAAALQADLEQVLGLDPLTTAASPFALDQFASVFVLDEQQNLLASTPQFTALPADGRFFDARLLTGDESLGPVVAAALAGDGEAGKPYSRITSEALYMVFAEALRLADGRLLGVEVVIVRIPTPTTVMLIVLAVVGGFLTVFALAAALMGTLFGWRTARRLGGRLAHLSDMTAAWGQGNFARQIQDNEADEIGELGHNLNRVSTDLQTLLADKEQIAVLEERDRMARELHDTLAQGVAGLILQLEAVKHHLSEGQVAESQQIIGDASTQARDALHKARASIADLRAEAMLAPAFVANVRQRTQKFADTHKIQVELTAALPDDLLLPPALALHARRAVSEMLANVARHAQATAVWVTLRQVGADLEIEVRDDGVGFVVEKAVRPGHYGIIGLKERARLTGGQFTIRSAPGQGTTAWLRLPLEGQNE